MITALEFHEVASVFPLMEGQEFTEFREDIREHGLKEPIWLHDGRIIDGRNRYRACQALNIEPELREWDGEGDLTAFVVSLNLHRRHLTESQRAVVAARIKPRFEPEAKQRKVAAQNNHAARAVVANLPQQVKANGAADHGPVSANLREQAHGKARDEAAALLNVSPRSVEAASKVLKNGVPELVKAVERGDAKVAAAAAVASLPKPEQTRVVSEGPKAIKTKAKEIRKNKVKGDPRLPMAERYRGHLLKCIGDVDDLTRAVAAELRDGGYGGLHSVLKLLGRDESLRVAGKLENLIERLQGWETRIKEFYGE